MQVSVAQIKAKFTAIARHADAGEEVIITSRGKPAYRLLPIVDAAQRAPFPDITAIAKKSRPYKVSKTGGAKGAVVGNFVADWREANERF